MRLIGRNRKEGSIKLAVDDSEDLWLLRLIIMPGDNVKGTSTRKVKVTEKDAVKKTYSFELEVEKTEFTGDTLRILGIILNEIDDVPKGSHQSIALSPGDVFTLTKEWNGYYEKRVEDALNRSKAKAIIILFDRDSALFFESGARLKKLLEIKGESQKKQYDSVSSNFMRQVAEQASKVSKESPIIFCAPGFFLDEIKKELSSFPELSNTAFIAVSDVSESSLKEIINRKEIGRFIASSQSLNEIRVMQDLLSSISKGSKASYGMKEVSSSISAGAAEKLIISSKLIEKYLEKDEFHIIDQLMRDALASRADIMIVENHEESRRQLDALGGIAAILRYDI
jgi:protein pelota